MLHFGVLGSDKPQWHLEALFGDICRSYGTVKHTHSHTHTKSTYKFGSEKTLVSFAWTADTAPKIMFEVSSLQTCCMLLAQWVTPALGHTTSTPTPTPTPISAKQKITLIRQATTPTMTGIYSVCVCKCLWWVYVCVYKLDRLKLFYGHSCHMPHSSLQLPLPIATNAADTDLENPATIKDTAIQDTSSYYPIPIPCG